MTKSVRESQNHATTRSRPDAVAVNEDHLRRTGGSVTGRLESIWLKRAKGGPMDPVDAAVLEVDRGLRGNANRGGKRQVTIISRERWNELMDALGANLPPRARRAN